MSVIIPQAELDKVTKLFNVVLPLEVRKVQQDAVAVTAAEGRRKEQTSASKLKYGLTQLTWDSYAKTYRIRRFSKWTATVGYVSTSRKDKNGNPYRMASFAWERAKKGRVTAAYTNQMANLWGKPTKPYSRRSPTVGLWDRKQFKRWKVGESRPVKYDWSRAESIIAAAMPTGVAKAEERLKKRMESEIQ